MYVISVIRNRQEFVLDSGIKLVILSKQVLKHTKKHGCMIDDYNYLRCTYKVL